LTATIEYRSAVADYLDDRDRGQLWTTDFPFPLMVVASTTETDQVTGAVTTVQYQYHEAHYQRQTRQFQGFRTNGTCGEGRRKPARYQDRIPLLATEWSGSLAMAFSTRR
jgi:hypothetical protein